MYEYAATLGEVHDGDTMHFTVDLGFGIESNHPIRLDGVNAPELATPAGKASLAWVQAWFTQHPGPYVLNTKKNHETEKYGRYLARVTAADGSVLNDDLLSAGQAVPYNP